MYGKNYGTLRYSLDLQLYTKLLFFHYTYVWKMCTPRERLLNNSFEMVGKNNNLKFRINVGKRSCVLFMRAVQQGVNSITTRVRFWILIDDLDKQLFPLALYRCIDRIYSKYHPDICRIRNTAVYSIRKANAFYGFVIRTTHYGRSHEKPIFERTLSMDWIVEKVAYSTLR